METAKSNEAAGNGGDKEESEEYVLQFNNYSHFLTSGVESCRHLEHFVDVSLVSETSRVHKAHRVILSACSPYFERVLSHPDLPKWQHPVLLLKDVPERDLSDILQFVYVGKVHVQQNRLSSFLKSAQTLKIRGLATRGAENGGGKTKNNVLSENSAVPSAAAAAEASTEKPESAPTTKRSSQKNDEGGGSLRTEPPTNKRFRRSSVVTATITPANSVNAKKDAAAPEPSYNVLLVKNEPPDPDPLLKSNDMTNDKSPTSSEHLVIPADPTIVQGLDPGSLEADGEPGPSNAAGPSSSFAERSQDQHRAQSCKNSTSSSKTTSEKGRPEGGGGGNSLVVLFSEKGRCHFCRLLCADVATLRAHLEGVHQPPRHALCENCENFFHICAIQRHRQKCTETYQSEKKQKR